MNAAPELPGTTHALDVRRVRLGRTMAGGLCYGTSARCACGQWRYRTNDAPSAGGRARVRVAYADHLAASERMREE